MGYCTHMIIGVAASVETDCFFSNNDSTYYWLDPVAEFSLGKIYNTSLENLIKQHGREQQKSPYVYCYDGNTEFHTDNYGERLVGIKPEIVIANWDLLDVYSLPALMLLTTMHKNSNNNLMVAFYGS